MKSRLKKVALMAPNMVEKQIDQISDKGRAILKSIEEYKLFVEQISKDNTNLTQMIINKKKNLDQASQQIYDVIFDIENMDVTTTYYNQQKPTELSKDPIQQHENNPVTIPTPVAPTPSIPGNSPVNPTDSNNPNPTQPTLTKQPAPTNPPFKNKHHTKDDNNDDNDKNKDKNKNKDKKDSEGKEDSSKDE